MRFGLIGAGGIGQVRAQAVARVPGCSLVAVADMDAERARAIATTARAEIFADYRQMLARADLDAVIVSTPPPSHEEMAIAAMEAGKHVLCEKPLSNSPAAARRMVETARRTGRTLATGFNHRYFPAVQLVKQTLDSGLIGELDHVRAFAGHTGLAEFSAPWMYDKQVVGGGALMDNGIHIIDLTRYLLGEVEEVFGFATNNVWRLNGSEDNACALLRGVNGKYATLQATWSEWKGYRFYVEVYGTKGMARAYYAPMISLVVSMDAPGAPRRRRLNLYPLNIVREKLYGWQATARATFERELADFIGLCRGEPNAIADGFAGFRAVEIADAVYRSTRERQPIKLALPF